MRFVSDDLADALATLGARAAFGLMGEDTALLVAALADAGVAYYATRHESAAVGMADGYAWASGEVSVGVITRGPGLTNALTAAATAVRARSRVLLISGAPPVERWYEPDPKLVAQRAAAEAVGLHYVEVRDPAAVRSGLANAVRAVRAGRPAVLAIASDVLAAPAAPGIGPSDGPPPLAAPLPLAAADVESALVALHAAQRPLLLAGRGAVHARDDLERLAARTGALLATTLPAKDLFRGSPYDLGVVGGFATEPAAALLAEVDCVLAFGASLNDFTTAQRTLFADATVVHIDIDPGRLGAHFSVDHAIVADAAAVASALLAAQPSPHDPDALRRLRGPLYSGPDESSCAGIDPRTVAVVLDRLLPERRTIVVDVGRFSAIPARYMRSGGFGTFRFAGDFAAVGSGLGPALGAALARHGEPTVLFVGDGGMMMTLPDLETAARYGVPLLVVVMNDRAFGAERHVLTEAGRSGHHVEFPDVDFAAVASALGIRALTVRRPHDLEVVALDGPWLLDCKLRADVPIPRARGARQRA